MYSKKQVTRNGRPNDICLHIDPADSDVTSSLCSVAAGSLFYLSTRCLHNAHIHTHGATGQHKPWTCHCHCKKFLCTSPDALTRIDGDNQVKQKRNVNLARGNTTMTNEIIGLMGRRKVLPHISPSASARTNAQLFGDIIIKITVLLWPVVTWLQCGLEQGSATPTLASMDL